jgi:D-alanine-D-alanine ligase
MDMTILFGGSSYEHEISIVSAISLKKILKNARLDFVFLDQDREFYYIEDKDMRSTYFADLKYKDAKKLDITKKGFISSGLFKKSIITPNIIINLIHGRDGEDGKIASLLDFFEIPYIGPRVEASTLSYSKLLTKYLAQAVGVKVLDYEVLDRGSKVVNVEFPLIVKPLKLGSSIGVSIVKDQSELKYALDVAFEFDDRVLIEPFIDGVKEYNLAGCKCDEFVYSIIEEPQKNEFLDFDKKYMDFSRTKKTEEADIDDNLKHLMKDTFSKIYDPLFLGSLIRCDFFVKDGEVILNEINPVPGSMANYLFDDFESVLKELSRYIPKERTLKIDYRYINNIASAKGKAR